MATDHGGVEGLIAVRLRQADVVLEPSGDGAKGVMHHRKGAVAAVHGGAENADGGDVVELVKRLLLALHLAPDPVKMLGPATHLAGVQPRGRQAFPQQGCGDPQALFPLAALRGHRLLDLPESLRLQHLERQVFQLPLEPPDAEAIGQGGIDLTGFAGNALLLLRLEGAEGAHVVQPISEFHQHNADVAGHGEKHPPQIFRLGFGVVGEMNAPELGHAFHQRPNLGAEVLLQLPGRHLRVLHHVVKKAGGDHRRAGPDVAQQIRHGDGVDDVRLARGPKLPFVELKGEIEGRRQQRFGVGGTAVTRARRDVPHALLEPVGKRNAVVRRLTDQPSAGGEGLTGRRGESL